MKKIIVVFLITSLFSKCSFSQIWQKPKISSGLAFRVLPFTKYNDRQTTIYDIREYQDEDNKSRFFIDIDEKLPGKNNLSISFSNSITFERIPIFSKFDNTTGESIYIKRYKRDYFLNLKNKFKSKKNKFNFFVGLGAGLLNCGTAYTFNRAVYGFNYRTFYTQRVFTTNYILGFETSHLQISLVVHSFGSQNLQIPKIWLEPKFAYMIHSLKKKK